jgi:hypothetical protein
VSAWSVWGYSPTASPYGPVVFYGPVRATAVTMIRHGCSSPRAGIGLSRHEPARRNPGVNLPYGVKATVVCFRGGKAPTRRRRNLGAASLISFAMPEKVTLSPGPSGFLSYSPANSSSLLRLYHLRLRVGPSPFFNPISDGASEPEWTP